MPIRRILVPLDLSPIGEVKIAVAEEQARCFGAEVILLHVLPPGALDPSGEVSPAEAVARTYLDTVAARLRSQGVTALPLVRSGPTAATILQEARDQQVDLIILGTNVRGVLPSVVLGSVADQVVRQAPCPVLLVRPEPAAGAAPPLRSFLDDAARAGPLMQRALGVRTVPVAQIVGSVGRAHELGPDFRPLQRRLADEQRYRRVLEAMAKGVALPPVELYRLGFGYYVLDGHHRVAAAKALGQAEIEANVTEFVPLGDVEAQRAFAQRRAFERSTGLTRVEARHAETYERLAALIAEYQAERQIADRLLAARQWYETWYRPLVRRIRQLGLGRYFPGERSADIVARLAEFRAAELARTGEPLDWATALQRFVTMLRQRPAGPAGAPGGGAATLPGPPVPDATARSD